MSIVNSIISIHALREEGDSMSSFGLPLIALFLSTPSARRATIPKWTKVTPDSISIHALREEGDSISMSFAKAFLRFLSTPSARRATVPQ